MQDLISFSIWLTGAIVSGLSVIVKWEASKYVIGGVVTGTIAFIGVLLTNHAATVRQSEQLAAAAAENEAQRRDDKENKDLEKLHSLRRDIYLPLINSMMDAYNFVASSLDHTKKDHSAKKPLLKFNKQRSLVQLISKSETNSAIAYVYEYLESVLLHTADDWSTLDALRGAVSSVQSNLKHIEDKLTESVKHADSRDPIQKQNLGEIQQSISHWMDELRQYTNRETDAINRLERRIAFALKNLDSKITSVINLMRSEVHSELLSSVTPPHDPAAVMRNADLDVNRMLKIADDYSHTAHPPTPQPEVSQSPAAGTPSHPLPPEPSTPEEPASSSSVLLRDCPPN